MASQSTPRVYPSIDGAPSPHGRRTFEVTGRGLILGPFLHADEARPTSFGVELRTPNGERRTADAVIQVLFINPPPPIPRAQVVLLGLAKNDCPIGTQVWTLDRARP